MVTLLLSLLLLQAQGPEVRISADRQHLSVGDELTVEITATSRSLAPMQVQVPTLIGFELAGRSERTEVSQFGGANRTTTLELRLHALRPGRWTIGPVRAVQGSTSVLAGPLAIQVDEQPAAQQVATNPMLRRLLERALPPSRPGDPAVSLVVSSRAATVGEQVDVLTAAWFPRELRVQLRRPPTLQPPVIEGVWSYPQPVPPGIAATRSVGGTLYDLFVTHQVVFPLVAGRIEITPAILKYSVPLALQFFSQEQRYTLESQPETLSVTATPAAGRPAGFAGAVGQNLRIDRTVEPATARAGEPVTVAVSLSGDGNPALWPAPDLHWATGARAYPDRTDERVQVTSGRLGGTKTFRFTVVADSAGTLSLPGVSYAFYDTGTHAFRTTSVPAGALPVAPGNETRISRPLPPALLPAEGPPLAWRVGHDVPPWLWAVVIAVPPLGWLLRRARRRRAAPAPPLAPAATRGVEAELDAVLAQLVALPETLPESGLVAALRSAGVAAPDAERLVAIRERVRAARYGPDGGVVPDALAAEARALMGRVAPAARRRTAGWAVSAGLLLLVTVGSHQLWAGQADDPERLYARGSLHAAIEGFIRRTVEAPADPANWYNLGAAYYRLGYDGRAAAAWQQALRVSPRERAVRLALELVPPPEAGSASQLWLPPVTWEELALLGTLLWCAGWIVLAVHRSRRQRELGGALVAVALLLGAGALALRSWERRPLALTLAKQPLRLSPHERAPVVGSLETGAALRVVRRSSGWLLVSAPGERLGWVEADAIYQLRNL